MRKFLLVLTLVLSTLTVFGQSIKISNEGKEFIKKYESCVLTAYWDTNGYSIGYGHHSKEVHKTMKITQHQAEQLFIKDIKRTEAYVEAMIKDLPYTHNFSQGFIDGFVSFTYNVGPGGARNSIFYQRLKKCRVVNGKMNEEDLAYAMAGLKISKVHTTHHKQRRIGEYQMMIS